MAGARVDAIARGVISADALEPHERAIETLVKKSVQEPARLEPADLGPLVRTLGRAGALEVVTMLCAFHFINRVADLVGIRTDLPGVRTRGTWLWRLGVRIQGLVLGAVMDFGNQKPPDNVDCAETLAALTRVLGRDLPAGYAMFAESPACLAWLATCLDAWAGLDPDMRETVTRAVAAALPVSRADVTGFHARPEDPLEALAFVGTRYAARTTDALVDAVRRQRGCDDAALTDIIYTIAMCNCWERLDRLLAQVPEVAEEAPAGEPARVTPRADGRDEAGGAVAAFSG